MKKSVVKSLIAIIVAVLILGGAVAVLVIMLNKPKVSDILLDTTSVQKVFIQDEDFNYDGLKVYARMDDGSKKEIKGYTVDNSAFDNTTVNSYIIKVNYKDFSDKYSVKVIDAKTVTELVVTNVPKMFKGQTLQNSDLVVKAKYIDGNEEEIIDYTVKSFDSTTEGAKEAFIKYGNKELKFNVTVLGHLDYVNYVFDNLNKEPITSFSMEFVDEQRINYIHANGLYTKETGSSFTYQDWVQDGYWFSSESEPGKVLLTKKAYTLKGFFNDHILTTNFNYIYDDTLDFANNMYNYQMKHVRHELTSVSAIESDVVIEYNAGVLSLRINFESGDYDIYYVEDGRVSSMDVRSGTEGNITKVDYLIDTTYDIPSFNPNDFILVTE